MQVAFAKSLRTFPTFEIVARLLLRPNTTNVRSKPLLRCSLFSFPSQSINWAVVGGQINICIILILRGVDCDTNFSLSNSFKKEIKMKIISFARKKKNRERANIRYRKCHCTCEINRSNNELGQYLFLSSPILGPRNESASPYKLFSFFFYK